MMIFTLFLGLENHYYYFCDDDDDNNYERYKLQPISGHMMFKDYILLSSNQCGPNKDF